MCFKSNVLELLREWKLLMKLSTLLFLLYDLFLHTFIVCLLCSSKVPDPQV